ncbi:MAG: hypothetical protein J0M04_13810 [Verrucomicrobia bacterium]|nr:hypothetical protein [Verrucomicrobiota bacterium]
MEREITDGDHKIGPSPTVRLVRTIAIFSILGLVLVTGWMPDANLMTKSLVFGGVLAIGIVAWTYLEARNIVIRRSQVSRSSWWRIAALSLHPVMIPIYLIVLPIIVFLTVAWINHNHAEQAVAPNRSLPSSQNSTSSVRGSED